MPADDARDRKLDRGNDPLLPMEIRLEAQPARLLLIGRERSGRNVTLQLTQTPVLCCSRCWNRH